jgi:hypothetical protein
LGIVALDTLHRLRRAAPLPPATIRAIASMMDFQGCANAAWDRKRLPDADCESLRQQLQRAGLGSFVDDYARRLCAAETRRPSVGGDHRRFDDVRAYREAVARLSMAAPAALALYDASLDAALRATDDDADVATLFRVLMQCQIVDDVLDYAEDWSAALPSFLTATTPTSDALALTTGASRSYGDFFQRPAAILPLRAGLAVVSLATMIVLRVPWHHTAYATPHSTGGHGRDRCRCGRGRFRRLSSIGSGTDTARRQSRLRGLLRGSRSARLPR